MKIKILGALLFASILFATNSNATVLQDLQNQTLNGELFTHNLNGPASDGTGGTLTVHTRGDFYPGGQFNENYSVFIDGILLGSGISFDSPGAYNVFDRAFDDKEFSFDFALGAALLTSVMSDSLAVVTVDFGDGMNAFDPAYFSEVILNYNEGNIPEPTSLALFGLGLLAFGLGRRKIADSK